MDVEGQYGSGPGSESFFSWKDVIITTPTHTKEQTPAHPKNQNMRLPDIPLPPIPKDHSDWTDESVYGKCSKTQRKKRFLQLIGVCEYLNIDTAEIPPAKKLQAGAVKKSPNALHVQLTQQSLLTSHIHRRTTKKITAGCSTTSTTLTPSLLPSNVRRKQMRCS